MDLQAAFDAGFEAVKEYVDDRMACVEREASRERELRAAEFAAEMAELRALRVETKARLAELKDGRDGVNGKDGLNGKDGVAGRDGIDGIAGAKGVDGRDGANGADGRDVDADEVATRILDTVVARATEAALAAVVAIPAPKDGVAPSAREVAALVAEDALVAAREAAVAAVAGIPAPVPGKDGKDADPAHVQRLVDEAVARMPTPRDGKDGRDGVDGKSVTMDEIAPVLRELVATIPVPKDGRDGKDGAPGADGRDGIDGAAGKDGKDGVRGENGQDGRDGRDGKSVTFDEVAPFIRDLVAAIPAPKDGLDGKDGANGKDADPITVRAMVEELVSAIPPAERGLPGKDGVNGKDGLNGKDGAAGRDGVDGVPGVAGRDGIDGLSVKDINVTMSDDTTAVFSFAVGDNEHSFEVALPRALDGKDGRDGKDGLNGKDGSPGERGPEGAAGKLPVVRAWEDRVHAEADVVTHGGEVWQAVRTTGKEPPHSDWQRIAAKGAPGKSLNHRGTYDADAEYGENDAVMLQGSSFVAKRDNPGSCPGDGWRLLVSRGSRGERGEKGEQGEQGEAAAVLKMELRGESIVAVNDNGTEASVDLYPLLVRGG